MRHFELGFSIVVLLISVFFCLYTKFVIYPKIKTTIAKLDEPISWHTNCLVFAIYIVTASVASDRGLPQWLSIVATFSFIIHDIASFGVRRILETTNNRNVLNYVYVFIGLSFLFILLFFT